MKNLLLFALLFITFSSCVNYKRFTYVQPVKSEADSVYLNNAVSYKLQPADIVYVRITSLNKEITNIINPEVLNTGSVASGSPGSNFYLMGYSIDNEGCIDLPNMGKIEIAGLTIGEAKEKIQAVAFETTTDSRVDVKLVSFKISVIGEVKSPGQYTIFNNKANIFEAIALAGDLTYNGNRKNVLIMRTVGDSVKTIKVDVTTRSLLSSNKFYLLPNDIVYIEPLKTTVFRLRVTDYSTFLTLITSTITAVLLINTLNK
jgi:polysaccharide export outer membrane protein